LDPDEEEEDEAKELEYKKIQLTQGENAVKIRKNRDHKVWILFLKSKNFSKSKD